MQKGCLNADQFQAACDKRTTTIGVDLPKAGSEVLSPTSTTFSFRRLVALLPGEFDGEVFSCIVMMSNEALQRGQVGPFDCHIHLAC